VPGTLNSLLSLTIYCQPSLLYSFVQVPDPICHFLLHYFLLCTACHFVKTLYGRFVSSCATSAEGTSQLPFANHEWCATNHSPKPPATPRKDHGCRVRPSRSYHSRIVPKPNTRNGRGICLFRKRSSTAPILHSLVPCRTLSPTTPLALLLPATKKTLSAYTYHRLATLFLATVWKLRRTRCPEVLRRFLISPGQRLQCARVGVEPWALIHSILRPRLYHRTTSVTPIYLLRPCL
jgi:hypothetical protein